MTESFVTLSAYTLRSVANTPPNPFALLQERVSMLCGRSTAIGYNIVKVCIGKGGNGKYFYP